MGIERKYKDPDEATLYGVDWLDRLGEATITSSSWVVPAGITQVSASYTDTQTTIKLSGGTLGSTNRVTNRVTTSDGETLDQSIDVEIIEK